MSRRAVGILVLALAVAVPPLADAQPVVTEREVAGIPVIHKRIAGNEVVAVQLWLVGGSAALDEQTAGIERFIAEVAPRGTEKYDKDAFASRAARTGTDIGATAGFDYSVVTLRTVLDHWDEAWDLFTQAVLHPTFPADEVELVRRRILDALKAREDDPDGHLAVLANDLLYAGHPYAADPAGTIAAIEGLTRDDLVDWHRRRLARSDLVLVVVGDVPESDLESRVAAAFGGLPAGSRTPLAPEADPGPADLATVERDLPTNYVRGQFAAPHPGHVDHPPLQIALDILSDRLFEEIRTKRNLSYAVFAGLSQRRSNYGLLYVTATRPDTTLAVMLHEVERLVAEPVPTERLAEQVNVFLTQYWLGQETNMGQATTLGLYEVVGGGWEEAERFPERVRAVTPADLQRVAGRYLRDLHFVVLGPGDVDRALFTSR